MSQKKNKQMTRWGVGIGFTILSCLYFTLIIVVHFIWFAHLSIPPPRTFTLIIGIFFIVLGLPIFIIPGLAIHKYFKEGKLATTGIYAYLRHPIYGSWIVFIVPGIVLIINSLLGLTIPLFMYLSYRILIVKEERYLEDKFGGEYLEYKRKVGAIFPKFQTLFRKKDQ